MTGKPDLLVRMQEAVNSRDCLLRKAQTLVDDMEAMKRLLLASDLEERRRLTGEFTEAHGNTFPNDAVQQVVSGLIKAETAISDIHEEMCQRGFGHLVRNPLKKHGE